MDIFIANMPINITVLQLRRLFGEAGRNARLRVYNRTSRCGKTVCYGHAIVESEEAAQNVIGLLNGRRLNGSELMARPFIHRSGNKDRRTHHSLSAVWYGVNRRRGDRRGTF